MTEGDTIRFYPLNNCRLIGRVRYDVAWRTIRQDQRCAAQLILSTLGTPANRAPGTARSPNELRKWVQLGSAPKDWMT